MAVAQARSGEFDEVWEEIWLTEKGRKFQFNVTDQKKEVNCFVEVSDAALSDLFLKLPQVRFVRFIKIFKLCFTVV